MKIFSYRFTFLPLLCGFGVMSQKSKGAKFLHTQNNPCTKLLTGICIVGDRKTILYLGMRVTEKKPLIGLILELGRFTYVYLYIEGYFLSVCVSLSLHDTHHNKHSA